MHELEITMTTLKSLLSGASLLTVLASAALFADGMADLEAADKKEGALTVIALPHDWRNSAAVIDGFKAFGLKVAGVARAETSRRVDEMLSMVGLSGFGARFPYQLPVVNSSVSRWPAPSPPDRACWCWTNHCPLWMPRSALLCVAKSVPSSANSASPPFS